MAISEKRQRTNHIEKIIQEGLYNAWGNNKYGTDTVITKGMVDNAVNEIMKKIEPYILHQLKRLRREDLQE